MGGDLRCTSTPGEGSTFEFTLPLQIAAAETEPPRPAVPGAAAGVTAAPLPTLGGRVLLVDDSPVNLLVASTMLARCGVEVVPAEHGEQALERLRAQRFDLVLMDCHMPGLDGYAATQAWRQEEARRLLPRTPVVALTASAVEDDRGRCLAAGMDDYLVKPFEMDDLLGVVTRHLPAATDNPRPCRFSAASTIPASQPSAR